MQVVGKPACSFWSSFLEECIEHPIPLNMRARRSLGQSPLVLDIYVWMTHRMSYLSRRTIVSWI